MFALIQKETLKPRESATECYCLVVDSAGAENTDSSSTATKWSNKLGDYYVEWRRRSIVTIANTGEAKEEDNDDDDDDDEDDDENAMCGDQEDALFHVKTSIALPHVDVESFPFVIEPRMPTYGTMHRQLDIVYSIRNLSETRLLDIECRLDENEFFSIAAKKLVS